MANKFDARFKDCQLRIQRSLAELLKISKLSDISVSDLAKMANVSRSTFYVHYNNVYDVYDELVQKAMADVQTFDEHFSCQNAECASSGNVPYCERVRSDGDYAGITRQPQFFAAMMNLDDGTRHKGMIHPDADAEDAVVKAVSLFQMSGCHAVATSSLAKRDDWETIKAAIDRFIEGGMAAIKENGSTKPDRSSQTG